MGSRPLLFSGNSVSHGAFVHSDSHRRMTVSLGLLWSVLEERKGSMLLLTLTTAIGLSLFNPQCLPESSWITNRTTLESTRVSLMALMVQIAERNSTNHNLSISGDAGVEPRPSLTLSKHSTSELYPEPSGHTTLSECPMHGI